MASPPFLIATGSSSSTGNVTVNFGSLQKDDLQLLFVASANQAASAPAGYTEITNLAQGTGTAGAAGGVRLSAFYKVLDGTETGVTVSDTGDHTLLLTARYRGVDVSSPIHQSSGSVASSASTAVTFPSVTTSVNNCLILNIISSYEDSSSSRLSNWINAALVSITERSDIGTSVGTGSGLGFAEGVLSTAGATGSSTATLANASVQALGTIALKPSSANKIYPIVSEYSVEPSLVKLKSPSQDYKSWDIGSPHLAGTAASTNFVDGLAFKADGTKLYTIETTVFKVVRQYSLSTPWDITSLSYDSVSKIILDIQSIDFSSDGTKAVICTSSAVAFYSMSPAWDITTLTLIDGASISGQTALEGVCMKDDGSIVLVAGRSPARIYYITCPTPYSTSGATATAAMSPSYQPAGICIKPDGTRMFVTDVTNNFIVQYRLSTPYDPSTATDEGYRTSTISETDDPYELKFSGDGKRFYTVDTNISTNNIIQYDVASNPVIEPVVQPFTLTGKDVAFRLAKKLLAVKGTFNETGNNAILKRGLKIQPAAGSFTFSGQTAGLNKGKTLGAAVRSFNFTGLDSILKRTGKLPVTAGSFTLTGRSVILGKLFTASVTPVALTLTGIAASFARTRRLKADTASFIMTGDNTGYTDLKVPSTLFTFTSYAPTFAGEGIVNKVLVPSSLFSMNGYPPAVAAGANVEAPSTTFAMEPGVNFAIIEMIESCSGENVPLSHMKDSRELEADAYVDLFQIVLKNGDGVLHLKMNKTRDWQGNTYQGTLIKISGVGAYADDQVSRPSLSIWNPEGVFSSLVDKGMLNNARIYRIRVLKDDFDNDRPIYRRSQWRVTRVAGLVEPFINLELRDMLDGQNFLTPARMFMPPEFPTVSLQ